jgi:hypothetical protein
VQAPCTGAATQTAHGWISNNPAACGCGVRARNLRH